MFHFLVNHKIRIFDTIALFRLSKIQVDFKIQAAALAHNFFQNLYQFLRFLPGDNGVLQGKLHAVFLRKFGLCAVIHIVKQKAVLLYLFLYASLINIHKLSGGVLLRKTEFFYNFNFHMLAGKQLFLYLFFQCKNIAFMYQPRAGKINANPCFRRIRTYLGNLHLRQ